MSIGWDDYEPAPIEFLHSRIMELFHEFRCEKRGVLVTGHELNDIIAKAKTETYQKYPKQVNSKAILKTELIK